MKEKQIEEIGRIMCKYAHDYYGKVFANCKVCGLRNCVAINYAKELYNAGYRKIPEDGVVFTNDNAEELANLIVTSPQMQSVMSDLIKAWQKEAVEKILEMAGDIPIKDSNYVHYHDLLAWLEKIAKEFDVKKEWL